MIRSFSIDDAEKCRDIIKRCFENNVVLEEIAKRFVKERFKKEGYLEAKSKDYPFFVYEKQNNILAISAVEVNEIKKLYVDPNCQGRGIGSEMLIHLEKIAVNNGHNRFNLHSFKNSVSFYESHGYVITGEKIFKREGIKIPTISMEKYFTNVA